MFQPIGVCRSEFAFQPILTALLHRRTSPQRRKERRGNTEFLSLRRLCTLRASAVNQLSAKRSSAIYGIAFLKTLPSPDDPGKPSRSEGVKPIGPFSLLTDRIIRSPIA